MNILIEDRKFILSEVTEEMYEDCVRFLNDDEIKKHFYSNKVDELNIESFVKKLDIAKDKKIIVFTIYENNNNELGNFIGMAKISKYPPAPFFISIAIKKEFRRKGYGSHLLSKLCRYVQIGYNQSKVCMNCFSTDNDSYKFIIENGFELFDNSFGLCYFRKHL